MNLIGAFSQPAVGMLMEEWLSPLSDVDYQGTVSSPQMFNDLCARCAPDAALVGGGYLAHVLKTRSLLAANGLAEPSWIALIGPPAIYSREEALAVAVSVEIRLEDLDTRSLSDALNQARGVAVAQPLGEIRILTMFPTATSHTTLSALLEPWTEFRVLENCESVNETVDRIASSSPQMIIFDHRYIDDMAEIDERVSSHGLEMPRRVLLLSHIDPATLLRVAALGISLILTSEQLESTDGFADSLRAIIEDGAPNSSGLTRIMSNLHIAEDDDDLSILRLLLSGLRNVAIAETIFLSEQTVKNRLSRMMRTAGVTNRTELALLFVITRAPERRSQD